MNLQDRDLKLNLRGDDVALLLRDLAITGLTVPDAERDQSLFGQGTYEAVAQLRALHGANRRGRCRDGASVGKDVQLAYAATEDEGGYCATFNVTDRRQRGKRRPDLQARVFAGELLLVASEV
jgi:hypothetical protein